jgi:hypothetical protein
MTELISMDIKAVGAMIGDIIAGTDMVVLKIRRADCIVCLENAQHMMTFGEDTVISIYRWSH